MERASVNNIQIDEMKTIQLAKQSWSTELKDVFDTVMIINLQRIKFIIKN